MGTRPGAGWLSYWRRKVVETASADTLADGMATRVPDPAALAIIRRGASRIVTVGDAEVAAAIRAYWQDTHNLAEGAGAAPLAALLQEAPRMRRRRAGLFADDLRAAEAALRRAIARRRQAETLGKGAEA